MTREEAKALLPIIKAYADGKKIQVKCKIDSNAITEHWVDVINPDLDNPNCYRIKPEEKVRPFKDAAECWAEMWKHDPFGWVVNRNDKSFSCLASVEGDAIVCDLGEWAYDLAKERLAFADGEPFGVIEEVEP